MKTIGKDKVIYAMSKDNEPVERVKSGETLVFETCDCFSDSIQTEDTLVTNIDFSHVNPATGPVYVEDAKAGDILKVKIKSIDLNDQGAVIVAPGFGLLGEFIEEPATRILPLKDGKVEYLGKKLKLNKMIGVIGTSPAGEAVATGTPCKHGGNMDSLAIGEDTTLYLPVEVDGALFALGDLHATMGDGEIGASGVEIAGKVTVELEVIKDKELPTPFVASKKKLVTIASDPDWKTAGLNAANNMAKFLETNTKLSYNEAVMLLSATGDLRVNQVVNPNVSFRMEIPRKVAKKYMK